MSLEKKLLQFRNNYPTCNSSVGSLMYFATFSEEYGIKLSKSELEELGIMCKLKMNNDFTGTTTFVFQTLRNLFDDTSKGIQINLPKSIFDITCYTDSKTFHSDFVELYSQKKYQKELSVVDDKAKDRFARIKTGRFRETTTKPIEIYTLTEEDLIKLNPNLNPNYFKGFSNVRWRKKSVESLILKESIRQARILYPSQKDLDRIDIKKSKLIDEEKLKDSLVSFMGYILQSGKSFHKTINDINYLVQGEEYGILKSHYAHHFIDLASDMILTDSGGGTLVMKDPELYKKLDRMYLNGISTFSQIKYEDNFFTDSKDRSVAASFVGVDEGTYFEMRLRLPWIDIKADYGEWAHDDYKKDEFKNYKFKYMSYKTLRSNIKKLNIMFKTNIDDVFKI